MTRLVPALAAVLLLLVSAVTVTPDVAASRAHSTGVHLTLLPSSGPHIIVDRTLVTFHLRISGVELDAKDIGRRQVAGRGHVQIYLDRIPADAYRTTDMRGIVTVTAAATFSVGFTPAWLKRHRGSHRFLVTLAQNNDVLYHLPPATFNVAVR